jgi:hypothetical protein
MDDGVSEPGGGFEPAGPVPVDHSGPDAGAAEAWPALCEQFALRILAAAYQTGGQLAAVEADEQDPARLAQFYRIDHANTRIRRQAENLLVLAGRSVDDAGRQVTSLLDVVRAATSAIEHYPRVRLGVIAHLAVVDFAADDVIRVLTEVLDNAARFSPPTAPVTVSAHLTELGSVLVRVEDSGLGFTPRQLASVNAMLASTAPVAVADAGATRLGLLVVQRLGAAHQMGVRLTARPGGGTTATALLPAGLLCEIPTGPEAPVHALPPGQFPSPQLPRQPSLPSGQLRSGQVAAGPGSGGLADFHAVLADPRTAPGGPAGERDGTGPLGERNGTGPLGERNGGVAPPFGPGTTRHGLPRREPASLRGDPSPRPPSLPGPAAGSDQLAWPEETMDFAAGFQDGRQPPGTRSEGHLDDQPAQ